MIIIIIQKVSLHKMKRAVDEMSDDLFKMMQI